VTGLQGLPRRRTFLAFGNLGTCYDFGIGVAKDQAKAATLYEQAANAGDLQSILNIGVDYWRGEGVDKDLAKAYMWLDLVRSLRITMSRMPPRPVPPPPNFCVPDSCVRPLSTQLRN
jgi:hypothetical protein